MAYDTSKIRLFVEHDLAAGAVIALERGQVHYLANVMRRRDGDTVYLFNGRDGEWRASLAALSKKHGDAIPGVRTRAQMSPPDLTLLFAPVKGARTDFIAQKATEMGVSALQPVLTERTVVRKVNLEKLHANAMEAAEQCQGLWVPVVHDPVTLDHVLAAWPADRGLVFCDEAGDEEAFATLAGARGRYASWSILVGPEGGFSDRERDRIRGLKQAIPIAMGPRILRADTAALAALTAFQSALGDWHIHPRPVVDA